MRTTPIAMSVPFSILLRLPTIPKFEPRIADDSDDDAIHTILAGRQSNEVFFRFLSHKLLMFPSSYRTSDDYTGLIIMNHPCWCLTTKRNEPLIKRNKRPFVGLFLLLPVLNFSAWWQKREFNILKLIICYRKILNTML